MNVLKKELPMTTFKNHALYSLFMKAHTDKSEALTSLEMLLNHPAGIGDHRLSTLEKNFPELQQLLKEAANKES